MRTSVRLAVAAVGFGVGLAGGVVFAQGSLTPPGAPAETMKTLDQLYQAMGKVDPRTPITNAPYTITQSGSYYLATNINSTWHGITVESSDVTLDLMGFALTGDGTTAYKGVWVKSVSNVVVRGGTIGRFGIGMQFDRTRNCRIEGMIVSGNAQYGILMEGTSGVCKGNAIAHCTINDNASTGIILNSASGLCNANSIADCVISGNGWDGIALGGASGQCDGNSVANCTIGTSSNIGVLLSGSSGRCNGNSVVDCTVSACSLYGIKLDGSGPGECTGNRINRCVLSTNTISGISLVSANGNTIENNLVSRTSGSPSYGINLGTSASNLVVRNTCVGQTVNFIVPANNAYGPYVTTMGALATTNGAPELSPWANFSW